jgi:folate-binding protein YgfZ
LVKIQPQNYSELLVEGKDAEDFLHRLTTSHMKRLQVGKGVKGLVLNGFGKLITDYICARLEAEKFAFIGEAERIDALSSHFDSMLFAEAVTLQKRIGKGGVATGIHTWDTMPADGFPFVKKNEALLWPIGVESISGIFTSGNLPVGENFSDWEFLRIQNKIPAYKKEWQEGDNALDVGFEDWIHRDKGCYPGQEVVERSLNVGHPAKTLVLLSLPAIAEQGTKIFLANTPEKEVGAVTSAAQKGDEILALAIVQWNARQIGNLFIVDGKGAKCLK